MIVQILIYTVLGALVSLTAYAAGRPISKSSRDELESGQDNEEEPAVKPKNQSP